MSDNLNDITDKMNQLDSKAKEFSDLLDSIQSTDDKKKMLWREIYGNAITDRMNAHMLFTSIYTSMGNSTGDQVAVSPALTKYLERMNKSNDQLLKLAELIAKEEERSATLDPEDIFSKIDK
tara:strand:- start:2849 stop:3214 length:366 start_codon:yes stop_codon:yes gene_type:complete